MDIYTELDDIWKIHKTNKAGRPSRQYKLLKALTYFKRVEAATILEASVLLHNLLPAATKAECVEFMMEFSDDADRLRIEQIFNTLFNNQSPIQPVEIEQESKVQRYVDQWIRTGTNFFRVFYTPQADDCYPTHQQCPDVTEYIAMKAARVYTYLLMQNTVGVKPPTPNNIRQKFVLKGPDLRQTLDLIAYTGRIFPIDVSKDTGRVTRRITLRADGQPPEPFTRHRLHSGALLVKPLADEVAAGVRALRGQTLLTTPSVFQRIVLAELEFPDAEYQEVT